ncbi:S1C family serine protease [Candidatus Pelagibacter ubique]|nr:S1C family serine protease [Candidatus Pelagibacter ubique]
MKKLLGVVVLALLWCETSFALSQESLIKQYLSDRKLDLIEGVWADNYGNIAMYAKSGNGYEIIRIRHHTERIGERVGFLNKGSQNYYYGRGRVYSSYEECNLTITISLRTGSWACSNVRASLTRLWPSNIVAHNSQYEKKKVAEKAKDKNNVQASSGTAFFVTKKGHIITNYHVVEGCKDKSKIIYQDNEYKAKLIAKDKYLDLALLKSELDNEYYIALSNKSPKKLQRIVTAGYPLGKELSDDLKFTSGIVSSLKGLEDDSTRIQIDAALNYGNSGGPIVDEKTGELVAVAVAGLDKKITESINFGIKAGSVKNFLDSNQINVDLTVKKFSLGDIDLASILENATVYTFCK